jgi:DNA gyrase/topoisomerase IV subunit A
VIDNNNVSADLIPLMTSMMAEMRKLQQTVGDLTEICSRHEKRTDELQLQLEKINKAHSDNRREQTDNLADVLEKISGEITARGKLCSQQLPKYSSFRYSRRSGHQPNERQLAQGCQEDC